MFKTKISQLILATLIIFPTSLLVATPKAYARNYYGAISYSRTTGSHGYSYNYGNGKAAGIRAIRECERYSGYGDCRVAVWFRNGCGALAKSPSRAFGSGWGATRFIAQRNAMTKCRQYSRYCTVVRSVCTSR